MARNNHFYLDYCIFIIIRGQNLNGISINCTALKNTVFVFKYLFPHRILYFYFKYIFMYLCPSLSTWDTKIYIHINTHNYLYKEQYKKNKNEILFSYLVLFSSWCQSSTLGIQFGKTTSNTLYAGMKDAILIIFCIEVILKVLPLIHRYHCFVLTAIQQYKDNKTK